MQDTHCQWIEVAWEDMGIYLSFATQNLCVCQCCILNVLHITLLLFEPYNGLMTVMYNFFFQEGRTALDLMVLKYRKDIAPLFAKVIDFMFISEFYFCCIMMYTIIS